MKTSKIVAVAALSLLAAVGAQAEEYEGVLTFNSALSRAEVQQQAVAAAHAANQNVDPSSVVAAAQSNPRDRLSVQAEAVAAAHNPTANLDAKSFVNSRIPAEYTNGSLATRRAADRAASL